MTLNNFALSAMETDSFNESEIDVIGMDDRMTVLFNMFFISDEDLVEINTRVYLYLKELIEIGDFSSINKFLNEPALAEAPVSIIKSTLIITDGIPEVQDYRDILQGIFNRKIKY